MKKVAIITIWDLWNYGNRLQNYAVSEIAKKKGLQPTTIIYKKKNTLDYKSRMMYLIWQVLFLISGGKKRVPEYRAGKFNKFTLDNIPFKKINNIRELENYDYLMIGSDQIWNANIVEPTEFEYGVGFDSNKVICMSPSFGVSGFDSNTESHISSLLSQMNNISVREHSGAEIVRRLTGKSAQVFIDPTLMLDAEEWEKLEKKPVRIANKKYILKYFLGKETQESIDDTARLNANNEYEVISFLNSKEIWSYVTGPAEFLYLIHNADIVLTDSFHACVFSILFRRPFWAYSRSGEKMNSRLETLFNLLELDNRFEHDKDNPFYIDFSKVDEALYKERVKVNKYIDKIINV